ncbi:iron complex transport system ATP-binding protein [Naumannella cuiyingiana]|uniref:Iron complex transport system ATP-binding protein n=1 Tax=Naumannella cuiyingiana TaxID=1347891 RepID=A0A7Z0D875_9ACTN|nr:ABC transporter ATP-binding protein [Naumannella cuiyingiana]NYI70736.1 iron complex transport system ATP-binding protein [Naumannella cuiyingiana]
MSSRLRAEGLVVGYGQQPVINGLDIEIGDGMITAIIGPNGCGKSTLLRTLARILKPAAGRVLLDDRPIESYAPRAVSQLMSILPQSPIAPEGLLVRDLVGRGRHPHQRWFSQWSREDEAAVEAALAMTDMGELRDRALDQLSGGQRQRAWLAMTLAQETDLVLLDEPTTYLDLAHQVDVLELVCRLNAERGRTVAMVLHDLNLAVRYAHRIVIMADGAIVAQGTPAEVFDAEMLRRVFGLDAEVIAVGRDGLPVVVPKTSIHDATGAPVREPVTAYATL